MKTRNLLILVGFAFFILFGCTPKTGEQVTTTTETPKQNTVPTDKSLSTCPNFSDAPDPDEASTNYVLYRDFLRSEKWEEAYELWQKVYKVSPAADGKRSTVFTDGVRFKKYFIGKTKDEAEKKRLKEEIFQLYDEMDKCYPKGGYALFSKAFDYFYEFPDLKSKEEIFDMFKRGIDMDGIKTPYFVLNPFTSLLVDMHQQKKISDEEAKKYQQIIRDVLAKGLAECKGQGCNKWKIIESYVPSRLEAFETIKGFYDCQYYKDRYYGEYEADPENCETIATTYSTLRWGQCPADDPQLQTLYQLMNGKCKPAPTSNPVMIQVREALNNGEYNKAIDLLKQAIAETSDGNRKGELNLLIAKVYYGHLKNFPQARKYALRAAANKPHWGDPYLLVGRLYASSGPRCGSGRGWNSQIVTWPAIDMWNKAKSVDPSVTSEANRMIAKYRKFMPTKEDIFLRGLKEGQSFTIGCWINTKTTIRAAP